MDLIRTIEAYQIVNLELENKVTHKEANQYLQTIANEVNMHDFMFSVIFLSFFNINSMSKVKKVPFEKLLDSTLLYYSSKTEQPEVLPYFREMMIRFYEVESSENSLVQHVTDEQLVFWCSMFSNEVETLRFIPDYCYHIMLYTLPKDETVSKFFNIIVSSINRGKSA